MKSSTKVLPVRNTLDALEVRVREVEIKTILLKAEDLLTEVRDARSVIDVATEAWGEENEHPASSCVGVLDLLNYKLNLIECALQDINGLGRTVEGRS